MKHSIHKLFIGTVLLALLGFTSCNGDERVNLDVAFFLGGNTFVESVVVDGNFSQTFLWISTDSDRAWTVTTSDYWLSVEPGTGDFALVRAGENTAGESRTGTITVSIGATSRTVTLTQQLPTEIDILGSTDFPNSGATQTLQIVTNVSWAASITTGSNFSRITTNASGTGSGTINITFDPNPSGTPRTANLRIAVADQDINLTLSQGEASVYSRPDQEIPFRLELPEVRNPRWFVDHNFFAMEFDTAQRHAVWVAFVFNRELRQRNVTRPNTDPWAYDPAIPRQYQWAYPRVANQPRDIPSFTVAGQFDRGHIMASSDRLHTRLANNETFFISNASPQFSRFNQSGGHWFNLEVLINRANNGWAWMFDTLYVVKGAAINRAGTLYTVNGQQHVFGGVQTLGTIPQRNDVTIARYWFMAMVGRVGNTFTGIAFWMENSPNSTGSVQRHHAITIRELEHRTGINFFPNLGVAFPAIYETVETNIDFSRWPGIN